MTAIGGIFLEEVMAAGRGQFISSFLEGLKRAPAQPAPGRPEPGRDRRKPGPGKGQKRGKRRKRPPKAAPCSVSKTDPRWAASTSTVLANKLHFCH